MPKRLPLEAPIFTVLSNQGTSGATVAEGQYSVSGRRIVLRGVEEDVNRELFRDILLPAEFSTLNLFDFNRLLFGCRMAL